MLTTAEALDRFERMLRAAGFDAERPDALVAWRAFRDFAALPVDCAEDGLLVQYGVYSFTGEPLFQLGFTRQFTHEEDGEHAGMEQLHCTLYYRPTPELDALEGSLWSFHCASLDDFFARAEATKAFRQLTAAGAPAPVSVLVDQEEV